MQVIANQPLMASKGIWAVIAPPEDVILHLMVSMMLVVTDGDG